MSSGHTFDLDGHWREVLLDKPVHPSAAAQLPDVLKKIAQEFLANAPAAPDARESDQLDRWYASAAGQDALAGFTRTLWTDMETISGSAMPAHDARHAMYKVPAASLDYLAASQVEGWQRIGILGALLHDYGRWAEERIFGFPGSSVLHARLSYLLGRELLETIDAPSTIKQQILLAAIRHSSGAEPDDPMPLKLTVAADRDQLTGPEIVLRLVHHAVGEQGMGSSLYGEKPGRPVLAHLEHFLINRLPGPLFSREAAVRHLWRLLATFLLIAEDADASRERFKRIPGPADFDWEVEFDRSRDHLGRSESPEDALSALLGAPHVAPGEGYRREAFEKLAGVTDANRPRLASALHFVNDARIALDAEQFAALERVARANAGDRMVGTLTDLLLRGWHGAPADP